jgi:hypothetical protein
MNTHIPSPPRLQVPNSGLQRPFAETTFRVLTQLLANCAAQHMRAARRFPLTSMDSIHHRAAAIALRFASRAAGNELLNEIRWRNRQ